MAHLISQGTETMTLVKICGLRDLDSATVALDSGAHLLGMILVPGRARTVSPTVAKQITALCGDRQKTPSVELVKILDSNRWPESAYELIKEHGPYAVGVFRNQSVQDINKAVEELGLDFVQLHGSEPRDEYIGQIEVPVITRYVPNDPEMHRVNEPKRQVLTLFDSEAGGEGKQLNWNELGQWGKESGAKYVLAGGLTPENVKEATSVHGVIGVDVSGGVETEGVKDHDKIKKFVTNALQ